MSNARPISVDRFPGIVPRYSDGTQVNQYATRSHNTERETTQLRAVGKPKVVCEVGQPIRTIYETDECECLTWDTCVDIVELPCHDEPSHYLWTGDGPPQIASGAELCAGESCRPGPTCPESAPQFSGAGCDDAGCETQTTTYVYTYKNRYGDESAPSPAAPVQQSSFTSPLSITIPAPNPETVDLYCITEVCLYRLGVGYKTGTEQQTRNDTSFWLVGCYPIGTNVIIDPMEKPKPYRLNTQGMAQMRLGAKNVTYLESGQVAWSLGKRVYLSPPLHPTLYGDSNQAYMVDLKCSVRCIIEWNQQLFVLTDGPIFRISNTQQAGRYQQQVTRYECDFPMCSKQAVVKGKNGIYFASENGIVFFNGETSQILTGQLFSREQWCRECCEGMVMGLCYGELILRGRYETYVIPVGEQGLSVEDGLAMSTIDIQPDTFYTRKDGTVLFAQDGVVYELPKCRDECCDCCDATYITPVVRHSCPVQYEAMRVWMRPEYGPVTMKLWSNTCGVRTLVHEQLVESCEPFLLPSCSIDHNFLIEFNFCSGWIDGYELVPCVADFGRLASAA